MDERGAARALTGAELQCWLTFLNAHTHLSRQLGTELESRHGISLPEHTVLSQLVLGGGHLRMSELAETVLLSPSGASRLVDRMAGEGLIERRPCDEDGRAVHAVITERGRARVAEAEATYTAALHSLFVDHYSPEEYEVLADLLLRLAPDCRRRRAGG